MLQFFKKNSIASNILMLAGSTAMAQLITICAMPLVTRIYSPSEIGIVSLFLSFFVFWSNIVSLRYEHAILIAESDFESHVVKSLSIFIVIFLSLLSVPVLWFFQKSNILNFEILPPWIPLIAFPIFLGHGVFMVYRSWALRGGLVHAITKASIFRSVASIITKLGLGIFGGGVAGLVMAELASSSVAMLKLMRETRNHFSESRPSRMEWFQMKKVAKKFSKFPVIETQSAWIDALAFTLPLPLVASLYGMEAAGWFGLARMVVSVPNSQIGSAVADVFQMELAKAVLKNDFLQAKSLFYSVFKKMALLGLVPLILISASAPWIFPWIFGERWGSAGLIAASLAPWLYAALIVSPLSRTLSVLQVQEWKLVYDVSALALLFGVYFLANLNQLKLIEFCLFFSLFNMLGYAIYAAILIRIIEKKLKIKHP